MNIFLLSCSWHERNIIQSFRCKAHPLRRRKRPQRSISRTFYANTHWLRQPGPWPGAEAVTVLTRCILNIPELTESEYGLFPAGLAHSGTWCKKSISSECAKKFCINFYIYSNQRLGIFSSYNGQLPGRHVVQAKRFPISDTMARVCHFLNFLHPV